MTDRDRLVDVIQGFIVLLKDLETNTEITKEGRLRIRRFYDDELRKDKEMLKDPVQE